MQGQAQGQEQGEQETGAAAVDEQHADEAGAARHERRDGEHEGIGGAAQGQAGEGDEGPGDQGGAHEGAVVAVLPSACAFLRRADCRRDVDLGDIDTGLAQFERTELGRGAVAERLAGDPVRADRLLHWVRDQSLANYLAISETYDPQTGKYKFNAPMVGFGAGVYALRDAPQAPRDAGDTQTPEPGPDATPEVPPPPPPPPRPGPGPRPPARASRPC